MKSDDIRYMPHEVRIAEGYMKAPEVKRDEDNSIECCRCGKTVLVARGQRVRENGQPVECPRNCQ